MDRTLAEDVSRLVVPRLAEDVVLKHRIGGVLAAIEEMMATGASISQRARSLLGEPTTWSEARLKCFVDDVNAYLIDPSNWRQEQENSRKATQTRPVLPPEPDHALEHDAIWMRFFGTPFGERIAPKRANPKFGEFMELGLAKKVVIAASDCTLPATGRTKKAPDLARAALAAALGVPNSEVQERFRPSDSLPILRSREFADAFHADLSAWQASWPGAAAASTLRHLSDQYWSTQHFLAAGGFCRVADALETLIARGAENSLHWRDKAGNARPVFLADLISVILGLSVRHPIPLEHRGHI